jgi:two-component system phosphate regulon sensor histidine kinase PhoR
MRRRKLFWKLYLSFLIISFLSLLAVSGYASRSLRQFYIEQTQSDLSARAHLVEKQISGKFKPPDSKYINELCKELGKSSQTRITIILPSGKVIGDSEEEPAVMDNHADRPEVIKALEGGMGSFIRYSHTLEKEMMYVAIPLKHGNDTIGIVRTSIPLRTIGDALKGAYIKVAIAGIVIAFLVAVVSLAISRWISRPLEEMKRVSGYFARGDLKHRLPVSGSEEMGSLAEAMNQMAAQLDERIQTIIRQSNEQEAILASMIEGVLAVDNDKRLISINQAAAKMLEVNVSEVQGKSIQEVVRITSLQDFVAKALRVMGPVEEEIFLQNGGEKFLQAHGATLHDAQGNAVGAVIVLNDMSRIKRLENIRREFVANVSHELKTPVTSVKGFVETLLEGALRVPEDAVRFLNIISKQVDRLNAIIEDLLLLSKIEQYEGKKEIELEEGKLKDVLESAIEFCEAKATEKNISIDLSCGDDVFARINPPLLEQALINLIDNSINASEPNTSIRVEVEQTEKEFTISVIDQGCGIEKEHLLRLFERFYRVDKARIRKMGGTGLGLAIVKHIAKAHGGNVSVESEPGKGSKFSIHLFSK